MTTSERDRNLIKILCERHTFCLVAPMGIKHVLILAFPTIILHNSGNTYLLVCPSFFTFIQGLPTKKNVLLHSLPQRDYKIALVCGFYLPARKYFLKLSMCVICTEKPLTFSPHFPARIEEQKCNVGRGNKELEIYESRFSRFHIA